MKHFDELLKHIEDYPIRKVVVAAAQDTYVIQAVAEAGEKSIAESILVGDETEIRSIADSAEISLEGMHVIDEVDPVRAVSVAVQIVSSGEADILMKGYIHTDDFLRGVLNREYGLRTGSIMSHVFIAEISDMNRLLFITDGAMNVNPDLEQKAAILLNAVHLANIFGVSNPKVAVLAAVELVNPAMPATVEAACLAKMAERNQYVPSCTVEGPLAMDNAVSLIAAKHKKISGPVAGQADILLVPSIESGNMLVKSIVYLGAHRLMGLLVGAKAPVVLTSRADTTESKLLSIIGAVRMVNVTRSLRLKVGKVHY
ncbi:MAG: bifunctional enoyl-CoA hydratase/phosphate acetyltransferase [Spirochaetes bacterium]|nr:bifunctional enoyl-CoA hydratase/phosphate acetyltransferase [Spirochaetota bacterium]